MVNFEVDPQKKLSQILRDASKQVQDLTLPLNLIAQQWFKSNNAIFALKGPGKYTPFQGRKDKDGKTRYQKQKIADHGFDYPLLLAGGRLMRSITDPKDTSSVNQIINKNSLVVGTSVEYAIYHQSKAARSVIPRRPMILFGNEQVAPGSLNIRISQWQKILYDYVGDVLGAK
jgi:phage gpG-like protein